MKVGTFFRTRIHSFCSIIAYIGVTAFACVSTENTVPPRHGDLTIPLIVFPSETKQRVAKQDKSTFIELCGVQDNDIVDQPIRVSKELRSIAEKQDDVTVNIRYGTMVFGKYSLEGGSCVILEY